MSDETTNKHLNAAQRLAVISGVPAPQNLHSPTASLGLYLQMVGRGLRGHAPNPAHTETPLTKAKLGDPQFDILFVPK